MIELKNIYLRIDGKTILKDISWDIRDGENWVLFGRNGAGKTKLLQVITGYSHQSDGEVVRFGEKCPGCDVRQLRKRIGYVSSPLRDMFYKSERLIDVVLSGIYASIGIYDEISNDQIDHAHALLSGVGMDNRADDEFGILSDGEKQKMLMLRAFMADPDLIIFDEVCAGLDLTSREDLLASIKKISEMKKTSIVLMTHHTEEIIDIFGKMFIIHNGSMFFSGDIADGLTDENMSAIFQRKVKVDRIGGRYYTRLVEGLR